MLEISHLLHFPQRVEPAAQMIYNEFWRDVVDGMSVADLAARLRTATDASKIPLSLIAVKGGELAGTVNLIENDDAKRAHLLPWLAAMVVRSDLRGQEIGTRSVNALLAQARAMKIDTVYLGTDEPRFYTRLRAIKHEQVRYDFYIMKLVLRLAYRRKLAVK